VIHVVIAIPNFNQLFSIGQSEENVKKLFHIYFG